MPTSPLLAPPAAAFPHTFELTVLFREFMAYWTGLKTEPLDWGRVQPGVKPVEFIVRWNGSAKGSLVVRTSDLLLEKLNGVLLERGLEFPDKSSLFREMATLYTLYLIHSLWMDDFFNLGTVLARPCEPQDRPPMAKSHSFCAIGVEGEPVEIRLWLDPPGPPPIPWLERNPEL